MTKSSPQASTSSGTALAELTASTITRQPAVASDLGEVGERIDDPGRRLVVRDQDRLAPGVRSAPGQIARQHRLAPGLVHPSHIQTEATGGAGHAVAEVATNGHHHLDRQARVNS